MSNFGSFSYFQTPLSLRVEQGLQKLPKFDINDIRLLFHCYILILRKCPRKIPFKTQCPTPPSSAYVIYEWSHRTPKDPVNLSLLRRLSEKPDNKPSKVRKLCIDVTFTFTFIKMLYKKFIILFHFQKVP